MYGPPQRPRAFRCKEIWNFEISRDESGEFTNVGYKLKESEDIIDG
jgi:hypothetical protein